MPPPEGFEWDETKNRINIQKHHVTFLRASKIFEGNVLEWEDTRRDYHETRIIAIGRAEGRLLRVVYTQRGNNKRIISARKAKPNDRRKYYHAFLR